MVISYVEWKILKFSILKKGKENYDEDLLENNVIKMPKYQ